VIGDGEAVYVLRAASLRTFIRALCSYSAAQGVRVAEAIEDGDLNHADRRVKSRRVIDDLLSFLEEGRIPLSRGYVRDDSELLPSEQPGSADDQPGDAEWDREADRRLAAREQPLDHADEARKQIG
jgi:hypothetical protein